jgi:hypothetical protein
VAWDAWELPCDGGADVVLPPGLSPPPPVLAPVLVGLDEDSEWLITILPTVVGTPLVTVPSDICGPEQAPPKPGFVMVNAEDCPIAPILSCTESMTVFPEAILTTQVNGGPADSPRSSIVGFGVAEERILNDHGPVPPCHENWMGSH